MHRFPFLVFSGLLVHPSASDEQEQIARTVRSAARRAADDINRMVGGLQLLAIALADSKMLQTSDLAASHVQASQLVQRQNLTTVLDNAAGQQLVNTSVPFGTNLPADPPAISHVIETDTTVVRLLRRTRGEDMANGGAIVPSTTRILYKPYRKDALPRLVHDALND